MTLREICYERLRYRYRKMTSEIEERVERELNVIESMGYEEYIMTVFEIINEARKLSIGIGAGRGSAVGSIVCYILGITAIDPLKYGLIFERFLNESRSTKADIDIDVSSDRREELIERLKVKFGRDKVAKLIAKDGSIHASGIVISKESLTKDLIPVEEAESMGLMKIDILGLKMLTAMKEMQSLTNLKKLPLIDDKTATLLSEGRTLGVFQLESEGIRKLLMKLKPKCYEDLIPLLALYRPGPLQSGMVDEYLRGGEMIIYQEQVMKIAQLKAGYTLSEADELRYAIAKKKIELLTNQRTKFISGCINRGMTESESITLFDKLLKFGGYAFNKSHATGYALMVWFCAYVKANYPKEFLIGLLNCADHKKLIEYLKLAEELKIKILPANINESDSKFKVIGDYVMFGLSAVKMMNQSMAESIIKIRSEGKFKSLYDFNCRVPRSIISKTTIEHLIEIGAFRDFEDINQPKLF